MIVDVCLPQIGFILCVHVLCYEFVVSGMISGIKTEPGCPHQRVVLAMKETTLHCILLPTGMDQTFQTSAPKYTLYPVVTPTVA